MSYEQLKNPCNTKDGNLQQSVSYTDTRITWILIL